MLDVQWVDRDRASNFNLSKRGHSKSDLAKLTVFIMASGQGNAVTITY